MKPAFEVTAGAAPIQRFFRRLGLAALLAVQHAGVPLAAGIAALADCAHTERAVAHTVRWRAWLDKELVKMGLEVLPSVANFVTVAFPTRQKMLAADKFLNARGIIVRQIHKYGLPRHLRITVGKADENRALVAALKTFLSK